MPESQQCSGAFRVISGDVGDHVVLEIEQGLQTTTVHTASVAANVLGIISRTLLEAVFVFLNMKDKETCGGGKLGSLKYCPETCLLQIMAY